MNLVELHDGYCLGRGKGDRNSVVCVWEAGLLVT